ncbi:class I SAM-dependent methyltransferase [Lentzea sp. CA-135723]|uniref:class I SAM-dependent methyltransferase n=1 Tax=Lentzea sp. CA-135723 TaxID=3239950 RepID=UPI003D927BDF
MNEVREFWDRHAARFDEEPDHGLLDPAVRDAWAALLLPLLPDGPARVVDLGCGTGSLSVLLARQGHHVRGVDLSGRMVAAARAKAEAAGVDAEFVEGHASQPPYEPGSADVVLARHVLWALPDPAAALKLWAGLLGPGGRMVLVEGRWSTGAGLRADECLRLVRNAGREGEVTLLDDAALWGREIDDERYLLVS